MFTIEAINEERAREILTWRYPIPYDFYDPPQDGRNTFYVEQFLRPEFAFHSILDRKDAFIGFCSYGRDGQVAGGDYSLQALDIGLGMKPNYTGHGNGAEFFETIERFAIQTFEPTSVRLTVAKFNRRAMHLYRSFGYDDLSYFVDAKNDIDYVILIKHLTRTLRT
ncbi:MAG: GNAT family N-acetyltransferase [Pseudomonadales bacterium]|nr:GNAT family N-acetyltransferase [Pseudomonadales bacterium]